MPNEHLDIGGNISPGNISNESLPSLAVYAADYWQHVCPIIRLISPAEQAGFKLLKGTEWLDHKLRIFPEIISQTDMVVITRDFPNRIAEYQIVMNEARKRGKFVVFELDDLLLELPKQHPDYEHYFTTRVAILRAVVEADAVVGSTPAICEYLQSFNANTFLFENYLDDRYWQFPEIVKHDSTHVSIGYMGGHSHSYDLQHVIPVLENIAHQYSHKVRLRFWGIEPPKSLRDLENVEWIPVALVDYRDFVEYFSQQRCDIYIAPLEDNLFNRCKSHLKFLEYSASGTPAVFSRVTPYERVVVHGTNGFLAGDAEEWEKYLIALIEDPLLRFQMGKAAQTTVRNQWLLSNHVDRWAELYRSFAKQQASPEKPATPRNIAQKMQSFQQDLERELSENYHAKAQLAEKDRLILEYGIISQQYQAMYELYQEVLQSRSWKLLEKLYRLRIRFIPRGSRREGLFGGIYRSLVVLKNLGIRATMIQLRREVSLFAKGPQPITQPETLEMKHILFTGSIPNQARCSLPAISVIVLDDETSPQVDTERVLKWAQEQTLSNGIEVVIWNKKKALAQRWAQPQIQNNQWNAPDVLSLIQGLQTKYVCLASEDLLQQDEIYLEINLFALETERLAFTVNLRGLATWATQKLDQGLLPGNQSLPLLRQVVLKECINEDFSLNFSTWLAKPHIISEEFQAIINKTDVQIPGKLINMTTNFSDQEGLLPFEQKIGNCLTLRDQHLILSPDEKSSVTKILHILLPADMLSQVDVLPSPLPTVIIIMPFLAVGGAEQIALNVMQELKDQVRFAVVTFEPLGKELGTTADSFRNITPLVYTLPDFMREPIFLSWMSYLIERLNPKALFIKNGTAWIYNSIGLIKKQYPAIRIVDQVYDTQVGWINRYDPAVIMFTDGHIAEHSKIAGAYIEKGAKPNQVFIIENGIDPHELDPAGYSTDQLQNLRVKFGLPLSGKVVTFASRLHPQKRPMDFVELARRFSSDPNLSFLMVGDGSLAPQINEQVQKIGLRNFYRYSFHKPISDILAITDVLVLPSEFEGMPMIIIQAQSMGKPVVVTDVGNNREVIDRTQGGEVIAGIGDIAAMAGAIQRLISNPPDPILLRKKTLAHFDIAIVAQKYRQALLGESDD
jgi:glycosyltransferase involved in cell wall biosynthesis